MLIAITRADGGLSIMRLLIDTSKMSAALVKEAIKNEVDRWSDGSPPPLSYKVVDDVPADRSFRNAWVHDGSTIAVDMPQAREIHRARLRAARTPLLAALDVEYMRGLEMGDTEGLKRVAAKKAALRDVTRAAGIDNAETPDELKAVWPDILSG